MQQLATPGPRFLAAGLLVLGAAAVGIALGVDRLGLGSGSGFGTKQLLLLVAGVAGLVTGAVIASPLGPRISWALRALPAQADGPVHPLLLAAFYGLASGLAQVVVLTARRFLLGESIKMSGDYLWMTPFANLLVLLAVGGLLSLLAWKLRAMDWSRAANIAYAFLALVSVLLMFSQLEGYAVVLLAAGVAVGWSRWLEAHHRWWRVLIRSVMGWTALVRRFVPNPASARAPEFSPTRRDFVAGTGVALASLALGAQGWQRVAERRAFAALPRVAGKAPNILLIVLDTVRASSLSLYGHSRPTTPHLEQLADRAVRFDLALATSPWTGPSHGTMFTGRYPHELAGRSWVQLPGADPTLAEILKAQGYATVSFVGNTGITAPDDSLSRGFVRYSDYPVSAGSLAYSSTLTRAVIVNPKFKDVFGAHGAIERHYSEGVTGAFLSWLESHGDHPFFAFLNYYDAHDPYYAPGDRISRFSRGKPLTAYEWSEADKLSTDEIRSLNDAYDAAILHQDQSLGRLFLDLERQGVLDNTVLIVTSDHGEQFGEHGLMGHCNSLYLPLLHVPLLMRWPDRLPSGISVSQTVSLRDLPATVLDLVGLNSQSLPGASMRRHWSAAAAAPDPDAVVAFAEVGSEVKERFTFPSWYPAKRGAMQSVVVGNLHYIKNEDGQEELYDLKQDPAEARDLAASEAGAVMLDRARAALRRHLAETRSA